MFQVNLIFKLYMTKMKGVGVLTGLLMFMMAVMAMSVSPSHAQAVDFDISCFLSCATGCLKTPTLPCLTKCITSCIAPSPSPSPSPSPPSPSPPSPPKPPMPPKPPATPPASPVSATMPSLAGLKSCNFECALGLCTGIETDMEKLECMGDCFKLSCDDN